MTVTWAVRSSLAAAAPRSAARSKSELMHTMSGGMGSGRWHVYAFSRGETVSGPKLRRPRREVAGGPGRLSPCLKACPPSKAAMG